MVIIKISGGLGNQLFQYSFGMYLSTLLDTKVLFDVQSNIRRKNYTARQLDLQNLNINIEVVDKKVIQGLKWTNDGFLSRIERKLVQLIPCLNSSYFVEKELHGNLDKIKLKSNCYYDGYWQNTLLANYIDPTTIFDKLVTKYKSEAIVEEIMGSESVSIHIRRGDYITIKKNKSIYNICEMDYYDAAIDYIRINCLKPTFYIFSDDIEWAKQNIVGDEFFYISDNEPIYDLWLMSLCKHNIIANSTFSWWAASLNTNKSKIVIAPEKWYANIKSNALTSFIPGNWIRK